MPQSNEETIRNQYKAYMLRCWTEEYQGEVIWRFSLEAVTDRQRKGFADLSSLFRFLRSVMFSPPSVLEKAICHPLPGKDEGSFDVDDSDTP